MPLDDEAAGWTELALQAAKRQESLVAEILDVFSSDRGAFVAPPDPAAARDLAKAIRDVVAQAQPAARVRHAEVRAEIEAAPLRVIAEETRLVRVLANLVDNALRHSPFGGLVMVSARREASTTRVNVDDQGPGVPKEVMPYLFEMFAGGQTGVAGTGLGLYFCRITVERWGGGIGYERRPEGGSRFWIRLSDGPEPSAEREESVRGRN